MRNHISTVRHRLAIAEAGYDEATAEMPGAQQAGPQSNDIAQGFCAQDVVSSLATTNNALSAAGFAAGLVAVSASVPAAIASLAAGTAGLLSSASQAFDASPACQAMDNGAKANALGLGAVIAP